MTVLTRTIRPLAMALGLLALAGCSALGAVEQAAAPVDAFTLAPVTPPDAAQTGLHIIVEPTEAPGALATDHILIKPNALQAQYLPGASWTDPAPALVQILLVGSLQNSGGFLRVGRDGGGLMPDYTVLSDLGDFQAEAGSDGRPGWQVRVGVTLSIVRESDRTLIASRHFESIAPAAADDTATLVNAFQTAMGEVLQDEVAWILRQVR
jgi:cholesterol transport system auxiliary component